MARATNTFARLITVFVVASLLLTGAKLLFSAKVYGAELSTRSLQLSDSIAGAHDITYNSSFTLATAGSLGSISFEFCSNSPFISDACTAPFGFDALNVAMTNQSGITNFNLSPNSTVNDIIITRPSTPVSAIPVSYTFSQLVNPTNNGSYYLRISTYPTTDASGAPTDTGALAFSINKNINVSAQVPPYLLFCTGVTIGGFDCSASTGNYVDYGELTADHTSAAVNQMLAATNAQSGYNIHLSGTTLTSGNNIINAMSGQTSQPGQSQFGLNLRTNSVPQVGQDVQGSGTGSVASGYNVPNHYRFNSGDLLASSTHADDWRKYTVSYVVNVGSDQPGGVYVATMTYVCLANF